LQELSYGEELKFLKNGSIITLMITLNLQSLTITVKLIENLLKSHGVILTKDHMRVDQFMKSNGSNDLLYKVFGNNIIIAKND